MVDSSLQTKFDLAAKLIEEFGKAGGKISNDQAKELYGLFKQATVGDINISKPGIFDQKGRTKWDWWNAKKGISKEQAMTEYIDTAKMILDEGRAAQLN